MRDDGLPVLSSQTFIWFILSSLPSNSPLTVSSLVFMHHPVKLSVSACFLVYFRKNTPWTLPKTSNSHKNRCMICCCCTYEMKTKKFFQLANFSPALIFMVLHYQVQISLADLDRMQLLRMRPMWKSIRSLHQNFLKSNSCLSLRLELQSITQKNICKAAMLCCAGCQNWMTLLRIPGATCRKSDGTFSELL